MQLSPRLSDNRIFYGLLIAVWLVLTVMACVLDGTNGGGDTIQHYLMARYAWQHPALFFNHWGKPVFTILSSPFAQAGFSGIKVFNVTISVLGCLLTYLTAKRMGMNNPILVLMFFWSAPASIHTSLSGLTEPLFALLLITGIYLFLADKPVPAVVLLSFLPMARSEGLIVLCVIGFYLAIKQKWILLPLLLVGQLVIACLGFFVYHDLLWVFNRIPYAKLSTIYETGTWYHFIDQMPFLLGPVSAGLMGLGMIWYCGRFLIRLLHKHSPEPFAWERMILIYGVYAAFLFSHSLFHYLGIFGEMGLSRVFVGVMPLMVIGCLEGFNLVIWPLKEMVKKIAAAVLALVVVFYCFGNTPFSLTYKRDLILNEDQRFIRDRLVPYLNAKHDDKRIYASNTALGYYLSRDPFNQDGYARMLSDKKPSFKLESDELIIWDSWFSPVEEQVSADSLQHNPNLKLDAAFRFTTSRGEELTYLLFTSPGR